MSSVSTSYATDTVHSPRTSIRCTNNHKRPIIIHIGGGNGGNGVRVNGRDLGSEGGRRTVTVDGDGRVELNGRRVEDIGVGRRPRGGRRQRRRNRGGGGGGGGAGGSGVAGGLPAVTVVSLYNTNRTNIANRGLGDSGGKAAAGARGDSGAAGGSGGRGGGRGGGGR